MHFFSFQRNPINFPPSIKQIPQTMKLEYSILEYLNNNDNGKFIDITFIEEDYTNLMEVLDELKGKNMVLVDDKSGRDFEAFGIGNDRKKSVKAKIKMNGRVHLHTLYEKNRASNASRKNRWSLSYFFSF